MTVPNTVFAVSWICLSVFCHYSLKHIRKTLNQPLTHQSIFSKDDSVTVYRRNLCFIRCKTFLSPPHPLHFSSSKLSFLRDVIDLLVPLCGSTKFYVLKTDMQIALIQSPARAGPRLGTGSSCLHGMI